MCLAAAMCLHYLFLFPSRRMDRSKNCFAIAVQPASVKSYNSQDDDAFTGTFQDQILQRCL